MSRTSRIPHPPGTRYVPIYAWARDTFGLAGAAIIGLLEFFDRARDVGGQPVASRARIIADLQGIVGKNLVDAALRELEQAGAIRRHTKTEPGDNNLTRTVAYGLDLSGLANLLGTPENGSSRNSRNRESPKLPKTGPESGVPTYIKSLEEEAAAPRADARGPGTAAADQDVKRRHPNRVGGMECWYAAEDPKARDIVADYPAEVIQAAVAAVRGRPNSAGNPTSPVPDLVLAEIEHQQQAREAAAQKASERAALDAIYAPKISPEDREKAAAWQAKLKKNRQQENAQ